MNRRPCPDLRRQWEEVQAYVMPQIKVAPSDCWEWQGHTNALGYAECGFGGRTWIVTRLMYCATQGDFDPQMDICHTCDNPPCINPLHLWLGTRKQNSRDCIEKGRHYKAVRTHCPRGHSYAEHGRPHSRNPNWRTCTACDRARMRISAGWPEDLAYSMPVVPHGERPVNINLRKNAPKKEVRKRTHCKRGHALEGDNIYPKANGGRQCKICHDSAAAAWIARGRVPLPNATS